MPATAAVRAAASRRAWSCPERVCPASRLQRLPDEGVRTPFRAMQIADDLERMREALTVLPDRHRQAVALRYIDGLDHRELRRQLGISDGALRGVLGRGLAHLRRLMGTR